MDDDFRMPDGVRELGEALRPVRYRLRSELARTVVASRQASDPVDIVSRHLNRLQQIADRLETSIGRLNADVLGDPRVGNPALPRAVGRLADCVEELTDGWRDVRSLRPDAAAAEMPDLLAGTYRHVLNEIEEWLDRLLRVIADPTAELARQRSRSSGPAEITLALKLTAPPQVPQLVQLANRQSPALELGFWGTAGLALLGAGLFGSLFGGDCDC
ncbi:MAG: hypothetical protein J0L57_04530 [Burkholderiales bacterium]|nr:hypothetical protein [Burkholderiales bacterium]